MKKEIIEIHKYFNLQKTNPSLFLPQKSPIEIIMDYDEIIDWKKKYPLGNQIGIIFQDQYITHIRDLVRFSDRSIATYNRIINTSTLSNDGIGAVILPKMGKKLLLLKIFRHPIRNWSIEVPRGFGEFGLTPLEIAYKEISEEIEGEIDDVIPLGIIHNNTGLEGNQVNLYLANLIKVGKLEINEGIEDLFWVTTTEFEDLIIKGEITDSFTISAYTRAKLLGLL